LVVYVGAIAVLFLFVIMLLETSTDELALPASNNVILGSIVILGFLLIVRIFLLNNFNLNFSMIDEKKYEPVTLLVAKNNITVIGEYLFTFKYIPFILSGLILLVGLIAVISLTFEPQTTRRQDVVIQNLRTIR